MKKKCTVVMNFSPTATEDLEALVQNSRDGTLERLFASALELSLFFERLQGEGNRTFVSCDGMQTMREIDFHSLVGP